MTFRSLTLRAAEPADTLVIALPGLRVKPEDFADHGFAAALPADMTALAIGPNDYFERDFAQTLRDEIVAPARAAGYGRILALGLSLGALGALRSVQRYAEDLDGLILLAPFLGNSGTIAEIERAGGLAAWTPEPVRPSDIERPGLLWLKTHAAGHRPWLRLGYGADDRFADGARLLAAILPPNAVMCMPGDHNWPAWTTLWRAMLPGMNL